MPFPERPDPMAPFAADIAAHKGLIEARDAFEGSLTSNAEPYPPQLTWRHWLGLGVGATVLLATCLGNVDLNGAAEPIQPKSTYRPVPAPSHPAGKSTGAVSGKGGSILNQTYRNY